MAREVTVGVIANPASGRDIRRLVAAASVFPNAEKANMIQRLLTAFGSLGVDRVLVSTDLGGISAAVLRAVGGSRPRSAPWPRVSFCDEVELTDTAADTTHAVAAMVREGIDALVCLGGDGTARVAAAACGDVPLLALSTGTNNAFGQLREATVAGTAVALVATGRARTRPRRASMLEVTTAGRVERALVDVGVCTDRHVGSRALWDPATISELYCAFAEPDAIGLSSVAGQLCPSPRAEPAGVALRLAPPERAGTLVHAPIAPGLVVPVGVRDWEPLPPERPRRLDVRGGVIALDGERELECAPGESATVTLRADGPYCIDIGTVLAEAAERGLLRQRRTPCQRVRHRVQPTEAQPTEARAADPARAGQPLGREAR